MALNRFFGRGRDAAQTPPSVDGEPAGEPPTGDDASDVYEEAPHRSWRERADAVLPTGASTGSKRAEALYGAADADGPTHFTSADGCFFTDADGETYLDCTMALGAVGLGYR